MIAIRLLSDGAVVREAVFGRESVLIGRGDECGFVVLDPTVSRQHARICHDEDGAAWIEDAGSRNGLRVDGSRVPKATLTPTTPLRCSLGAAELELVLSSADVTLEIPAPTRGWGAGASVMAIASWVAGITACLMLMLIDPDFWSPWEQDQSSELSWLGVGTAVGLPVLAFLLTGLFHIVGRKSSVGRVLRALAIACWGWLALGVVLRATPYVTSVALDRAISSLLVDAGVVATVTFLATVGRRRPLRQFVLVWTATLSLLLLGMHGAAWLAQRQAGTPQLDYRVDPPIAGVSGPSGSLEGYLGGLRADFAAAEKRGAAGTAEAGD